MVDNDSTSAPNETTTKSKRPNDSNFKQQKLPAWQPILTAGTVLPTFFVIGIIFIPIGVALLLVSNEVKEFEIDYTDCNKTEKGFNGKYTNSYQTCAAVLENSSFALCKCIIDFELEEDFLGEVFMYYGLSNYYQNHRRYVKSRDDHQLLGHLSDTPSTDCAPFNVKLSRAVVPCGAIANSMFNDELQIFTDKREKVPLIRTGIAWPSDKSIKFKNPTLNPGEKLKDVFQKYAKPDNWRRQIWELDPDNADNNGLENEDLIVWMRTAALPTFRKLYRRIDHSKEPYKTGLLKGNYTLHVFYNYSVSAFDGRKKMVLSTTSVFGGKNPFLGFAYIIVGCICIVLGVALLFIHIKCSSK